MNKRAYLLAFNATLGTQDQVKGFLSAIPEITHWRFDMGNSFYLVSEADATTLAHKLHELAPKGRFIITEINNYGGWLTADSWYLIKNKEYKSKPPAE